LAKEFFKSATRRRGAMESRGDLTRTRLESFVVNLLQQQIPLGQDYFNGNLLRASANLKPSVQLCIPAFYRNIESA
jgi:hypothetical protein